MVNVLDMPSRGLSQDEVWEEAFRVSKLFFMIEPVTCEAHGNFTLHLDCFKCQQRFKELSYRIFEELCEACDASTNDHVKEELADAVIFINLLFKLISYKFEIRPERWGYNHQYNFRKLLVNLGLMTNCLKLRPWRNQYSEVDLGQLKKASEQFIDSLVIVVANHFKDENDLLDFVDRKVQVNEFRFNSKY